MSSTIFRVIGTRSQLLVRSFSSKFSNSPIQVTVSDDGETIVCWQPEQLSCMKYEYTKSLTTSKPDSSAMVDERAIQDVKDMYKQDIREEDLIRLAYRPRIYWRYTTTQRKLYLRKPRPALDRVGI